MVGRDEAGAAAVLDRSTTLPRQASTVSTALIAAGIEPVWPTMSGLAKFSTANAGSWSAERLDEAIRDLSADISGLWS